LPSYRAFTDLKPFCCVLFIHYSALQVVLECIHHSNYLGWYNIALDKQPDCPCGLYQMLFQSPGSGRTMGIIFLSKKICSVVPLPHLNPACYFLSFDSVSNPVHPFILHFRHLHYQSFLPFPWCLSSLHTMSMISLSFILAKSMSALELFYFSGVLKPPIKLFGPVAFRCIYFLNLI